MTSKKNYYSVVDGRFNKYQLSDEDYLKLLQRAGVEPSTRTSNNITDLLKVLGEDAIADAAIDGTVKMVSGGGSSPTKPKYISPEATESKIPRNMTNQVSDWRIQEKIRARDAAKAAGTKQPFSLQGFFDKNVKPNVGWSAGKGLRLGDMSMGKVANPINALVQTGQALGNVGELADTYDTTNDILSDIINSASSNPIANMYLNADQKNLLNKVKNDSIDDGISFGDFIPDDFQGWLGALAPLVIGGVTGGIPGAVIGGLGGIVNSGLEGANQDQIRQQSELNALLQALQEAEMQQQVAKRQRYQNMYI